MLSISLSYILIYHCVITDVSFSRNIYRFCCLYVRIDLLWNLISVGAIIMDSITRESRMLSFAKTFSELDREQIRQFAGILFNIAEKVGFENNVNNILRTAGEYLNLSRAYIFEDDLTHNFTSNTFEWCNEGIAPEIKNLQNIPYEVISYWPETLKTESMIATHDIHTLPQEVVEILDPQGIKSIAVYPLRVDDNDQMIGFFGFDECARERKWSESELVYLEIIAKILSILYDQIRQEVRLKQLFDDNPHAQIFCREEDLSIVDANDAFLALCGYTREEIRGLSGWDFELFDSDSRKEELIAYLKMYDSFKMFESRIYSKDGKEFTGLFAGQMIELSGVRSWLIVITDITERKLLIADIEEQKYRLQQLIDATGAGTWEWEIQTGRVQINEEWAHLIGYTLEELEPVTIDTWFRFVYPGDKEKSSRLLEEHFKGITPVYDCDLRMRHKDGSLIWINDKGKVSERDEEGNPVRMFGTHTDITMRKQEELALESSFNSLMEGSKNTSEFLSHVTHEFRTPLNIIHSLNKLLLTTEMSEVQKNYLRKIEKSANELYGSISNLLDHTKLEAGRFMSHPSDTSFHTLLEEVVESFEFTGRETGLPLVSEIDPGIPEWLYIDGAVLKHIIENLIAFAYKIARRGNIRFLAGKVSSAQGGDRLVLKILTRGISQDPELFKSLTSEGFLTYEGGLDILTTKELVQFLSGNITGERIGSDTTLLRVNLPLIPGRKHTTQSPPEVRETMVSSDRTETGDEMQISLADVPAIESTLLAFRDVASLNDPVACAESFERLLEDERTALLLDSPLRQEIAGSLKRYRFQEIQDTVTDLLERVKGRMQ